MCHSLCGILCCGTVHAASHAVPTIRFPGCGLRRLGMHHSRHLFRCRRCRCHTWWPGGAATGMQHPGRARVAGVCGPHIQWYALAQLLLLAVVAPGILPHASPRESGNGVHARSLTRALLQQHACVVVGTAVPTDNVGDTAAQLGAALIPSELHDVVRELAWCRSANTTSATDSGGVGRECWRVPSLRVIALPVPRDKWYRLDRDSAWEEFMDRSGPAFNVGQAHHTGTSAVYSHARLDVDVVAGVDWSSLGVLHQVWDQHRAGIVDGQPPVPFAFLCFRVYSASLELLQAPGARTFYEQWEAAALRRASWTMALNRRDARKLQGLVKTIPRTRASLPAQLQRGGTVAYLQGATASPGRAHGASIDVVLPHLRRAVRQLSLGHVTHCNGSMGGVINQEQGTPEKMPIPTAPMSFTAAESAAWNATMAAGQRLLSSCVRLAPEKNPALFADVVQALAQPTPHSRGAPVVGSNAPLNAFMCAASSASPLASSVAGHVRGAVPGAVLSSSFLTPHDLAAVMLRTRLSIHPPLHDAFGMTVAEAAAYGVPSVVHERGIVAECAEAEASATCTAALQECVCVPDAVAWASNPTCSPHEGVGGGGGGVRYATWMHSGGRSRAQTPDVGVLDLLSRLHGDVVALDFELPTDIIAQQLRCMLSSGNYVATTGGGVGGSKLDDLAGVGCSARAVVHGWTSAEVGETMLRHLRSIAASTDRRAGFSAGG